MQQFSQIVQLPMLCYTICMSWKKKGEKVSKHLTGLVKGGHARKIIITDPQNKPVLHFPLLFFVIITLLLPVLAGILIFFFLLSEYHAVVEKSDEGK